MSAMFAYHVANFLTVILGLFFIFVSIAIPILIIILLIKAIKKLSKKNNDCDNCPYKQDITNVTIH